MATNIPRNYTKLGKIVASSSSTISFTSMINSNYSTYLLRIRTCIVSTNNANLTMLFSTDNGSSYLSSNYRYNYRVIDATGGGDDNGSLSASSILLSGDSSSNSSAYVNADIILYNLNSSTYSPKLFTQVYSCFPSNTGIALWTLGAMNTTTTPVNAIRIAPDAGTITSGTFTLYGIVEGGLYT